MLNDVLLVDLVELIAATQSLVRRAQEGASAEEVELLEASAKARADELQTELGVGPVDAFANLARHLHFIAYYHRRGHPEGYASDIANISERDLPAVISAVKDAASAPLNGELWKAIRPAWEAKRYTSAVRDAFIHFETVLRELGHADPSNAPVGSRLVVSVLGPTSPGKVDVRPDSFMGTLAANEAEGFYFMVKGAFALFRNATAHRAMDLRAHEAESVIRLVDLCLAMLPEPGPPAKSDIAAAE